MPMSQNLCSQIGMFSRKLFQAVLQKFLVYSFCLKQVKYKLMLNRNFFKQSLGLITKYHV